MNTEHSNLTSSMDIRHALERKLGYGAIQKIADARGIRAPVVHNAISGRRRSKRDMEILAYIASIVARPVMGINPDGSQADETIIACERDESRPKSREASK